VTHSRERVKLAPSPAADRDIASLAAKLIEVECDEAALDRD